MLNLILQDEENLSFTITSCYRKKTSPVNVDPYSEEHEVNLFLVKYFLIN